jgi:transcriptional regulator with XRE-family HTH domain
MKPAEIDPKYQDFIKQIGEQVKELRKVKNLTYVEMSKKVGLSKNGYNNIELGKSNLQLQSLLKILSYHKISIFEFFESLKE